MPEPDGHPESNWRRATHAERELVATTRALYLEYEALTGSPPSLEWLLREIGLAPQLPRDG